MSRQNILQKNYTKYQRAIQVKLPFDIEKIIPEDDSVILLSRIVEEMNLSDLYSTYQRIRENSVSPETLLKIVLYSYMCRDYSSRSIERNCNRDINYMYLLDGSPAPDHSTIARFRSKHFAPCAEKIMAELSMLLYDVKEISAQALFIDGTKIEASSNKYTFVWKKSITKYQQKVFDKVTSLILECEELYNFKIVRGSKVQVKDVKKLRKRLHALKVTQNIEFVYGCGKRKTSIQKHIEQVEIYLKKLKGYAKKLHTCGQRNSYSKTDTDATFMRLKEDHMQNGQLKPAYNLQHGVDSEYIVWLTIGHEPTDTTTLVPFLKGLENSMNFKYEKIVADAGYESEENYVFIKENNQKSYIKPSNYEISKTRKFKNDIGRMENMEYNTEEDFYICHNNKKLNFNRIYKSKSKTGYVSEKSVYTCEGCENCPHKKECIKEGTSKKPLEERSKTLYVAKTFIKNRAENLERLKTDEGCNLRVNRSIQVEGSFGELKRNMNFKRYLCRGKKNVLAESILLALAHNVNKLHNKIQGNKVGHHLY